MKSEIKEGIISILKNRGCSYPQEIAAELGISPPTASTYLNRLEAEGIVERMKLGYYLSPTLKKRIHELWAYNISGRKIRRLTWYKMREEL